MKPVQLTVNQRIRGMDMELKEYSCDKCDAKTYKSGELRTTGSGLSRFFNLQNQRYTTIACTECGFTEMYRMDGGGKAGNILDILSN
ncbi:MAG: zinc ribbon domain-containing protein [Dehalococcoidia bacterium]|nr:zinc ribbon domain-containing protein [Dehalococcoidia bacterium]